MSYFKGIIPFNLSHSQSIIHTSIIYKHIQTCISIQYIKLYCTLKDFIKIFNKDINA